MITNRVVPVSGFGELSPLTVLSVALPAAVDSVVSVTTPTTVGKYSFSVFDASDGEYLDSTILVHTDGSVTTRDERGGDSFELQYSDPTLQMLNSSGGARTLSIAFRKVQ